jgi:hypothetical protein
LVLEVVAEVDSVQEVVVVGGVAVVMVVEVAPVPVVAAELVA